MSIPAGFIPDIDLIRLGQPSNLETWLISEWNAGQSNIMQWSRNNVRKDADGSVELVLSASPTGAARPYTGGEIQ